MFIWTVHRISGILLIILLALKLLTAFYLMTRGQKPDWALTLHVTPALDAALLISLVFHAVYGLRTIAFDLGFRREKILFWLSTLLAAAVSALLLLVYFTRDY